MLTLSDHFCQRWAERLGGKVSPEEVERLISESVWIQKTLDVRLLSGRSYRMLSVFWHPERDVILKVDEINNVAVTILSPNVLPPKKRTFPVSELLKAADRPGYGSAVD